MLCHPSHNLLEFVRLVPVVEVANEFGSIGSLMYLEHNQILVGVNRFVLEARAAAKEQAFVHLCPFLKNVDGSCGGLTVAGEFPFKAELVCGSAVLIEIHIVVVDTGIEEVADTGIVPAAAAVAPVSGVKTREVFHRARLIVGVAEAACKQLVVSLCPRLLSEMALGVVKVGSAVEHARVVECIVRAGLVFFSRSWPAVDVGPSVLNLAAALCCENRGGRQYECQYLFHCRFRWF